MRHLQELAQYVRSTLPVPQAILQLRINGITFIWEGVEFFVNPGLTVLEARGNTVYVTALSMLLQSVLVAHRLEEAKIKGLLEELSEAETRLRNDRFNRGALD